MHTNATAVLREHGVQVTAQRLAVLRTVVAHPHATADQVTDLARLEIGAISKQAVYDALAVLVDKGILRRIQPLGSPARFEDRVADNHHHLVCRSCGQVVDVDCAVGGAPCLEPAQRHGFAVDEAEVLYWGICTTCQHGARASSGDVTHPPDHPRT